MKKSFLIACASVTSILMSQQALADFDYFKTDGSFKRFSVSAGWLHASPQGDANPLQNTTAINEGTVAQNGSIRVDTVKEVVDPNQSEDVLFEVNGLLNELPGDADLGELSGESTINGLQSWTSAGSGLQSDTVDTIGLLFNYYVDDNWSVEFKAGVPPKVDIMGKGQVFAPLTGTVNSQALPEFTIKKDIPITDLEQGNGVASTARAWLPAAGIQYQFGKSGVNKFRPYVVVGAMYAYFNDIELNEGIRSDLERAGDQIQNIKDGKAGAALEDVKSSRGMKVKVDAESALATIITVGGTYDFDDRWFAVGSLSYAKLDSETTITVKNDIGETLIRSKSNLDIDPYITYLGVGYRF